MAQINNNFNGYIPPDIPRLILGHEKGVKIGESCRISDIENIFSWMRGFLNCFTGWAGHGKTGVVQFLMLNKSVRDGWKWGIWSPEMIDTIKAENGQMVRTADKIYNILVHAYTGKNPYHHKQNQIDIKSYLEGMSFIQDHFFVFDSYRDKKPETIIKGFTDLHASFGIDGWLVDPFKNLSIDESSGQTKDRVIESVFDLFEDLALSTNTVGNFIAHPKSMDETKMRKKGKLDGAYKVVTQHDLLGGSAWDNSMDGVFSYYRQEKHLDPNSPKGSFYTLKQRSQELTTELGQYDKIYFDKTSNRFYFNDVCPIDGSMRLGKQAEAGFVEPFAKKKSQEVTVPDKANNDTPF